MRCIHAIFSIAMVLGLHCQALQSQGDPSFLVAVVAHQCAGVESGKAVCLGGCKRRRRACTPPVQDRRVSFCWPCYWQLL